MKVIFLSAQSTIKKRTISMHLQWCALKITELPTINVFPGSSINTPQFIHFSSSFNLLSPCNNKKKHFSASFNLLSHCKKKTSDNCKSKPHKSM